MMTQATGQADADVVAPKLPVQRFLPQTLCQGQANKTGQQDVEVNRGLNLVGSADLLSAYSRGYSWDATRLSLSLDM